MGVKRQRFMMSNKLRIATLSSEGRVLRLVVFTVNNSLSLLGPQRSLIPPFY